MGLYLYIYTLGLKKMKGQHEFKLNQTYQSCVELHRLCRRKKSPNLICPFLRKEYQNFFFQTLLAFSISDFLLLQNFLFSNFHFSDFLSTFRCRMSQHFRSNSETERNRGSDRFQCCHLQRCLQSGIFYYRHVAVHKL